MPKPTNNDRTFHTPRSQYLRAGAESYAERSPSDRIYATLHRTLMIIIAAILLYGVVIARLAPVPRGTTFRAALTIILSFNLLWWSIADRRIARHVPSRRRSAALRILVGGLSVALNTPIAYMLATAHAPSILDNGPTWYAAAVTLWHLGLVVVMPIVAVLRLAGLGAVWAVQAIGGRSQVARNPMPSPLPADPPVLPSSDCPQQPASAPAVFARAPQGSEPMTVPTSRRVFLKTAFASIPVIALTGLTGASQAQQGRFAVNRHRLPAPWLPHRLRGLTITHISDTHVGRHYRTYMLDELVEQANRLASDLVVFTGDVVDMSNQYLPAAIEAFSRISAPHGLFFCLGNHDQIDDRPAFIREIRARFPILLNQRRVIEIGGERLCLAGLDYGADHPIDDRHASHAANAAAALKDYDSRQEGPVIALSHHPHAFDALAEYGVPLTLAGHTHGGQLMLSRPDERPDIGIGRILFRYTRGFYHSGDSTLFVNSGVGNWFPLRLNAPAEIVQLQLTE